MTAKATEVLAILRKAYPDAKYYLDFRTPLDLLVAATISAQARDESVNAATAELFRHYRTAQDYSKATANDLLKHIGRLNFAGKKAKNIIAACKMLVEKHRGQVPKKIEELTALPGIGRKTATAILTNAFGIVPGIAVDTHVIRIAYRLGWTRQKRPEKIEQDINRLIPEKNWKEVQWLLKAHGRAVCLAQLPRCSECQLTRLCQKQGVTKKQ